MKTKPDVATPYTEAEADELENMAALVGYHVRVTGASLGSATAQLKHLGVWVEAMAVRDPHPCALPSGFACVHTVIDRLRWKFIEDDAVRQVGPVPKPCELLEPRDWWES